MCLWLPLSIYSKIWRPRDLRKCIGITVVSLFLLLYFLRSRLWETGHKLSYTQSSAASTKSRRLSTERQWQLYMHSNTGSSVIQTYVDMMREVARASCIVLGYQHQLSKIKAILIKLIAITKNISNYLLIYIKSRNEFHHRDILLHRNQNIQKNNKTWISVTFIVCLF